MDDHYSPRPVAGWFKLAAIASVLWLAIGCALYLYEVSLDPAKLPLDERAMYDALPTWMWAAFAIAVWVGLAGTVLLFLRRKLAEPLMLVSLIASLAQNSAYFIDSKLRGTLGSEEFLLPIILVAVEWTIFWFARHSRQRGWLR